MNKKKIKNKVNILIGIMICILSFGSVVFAACPPHNLVGGQLYNNGSSGHSKITSCSKCGRSVTNRFSHSYGSWSTTREATCTQEGVQRRSCACGYSQSRSISKKSHSYSGWKSDKNSHWKSCKNCGHTSSEGSHYDDNIDGYCDACNYLVAIPGSANISSNVSVMLGGSADFSINVIRGTAPITYQWYYNTTNSTSGGTKIAGATTTSISIPTTTKDMNGRYYYCAMTNKAGTHYSPMALLTVWYPFTIGTEPQDKNLKNGETGTFSVGIGDPGNPNNYTYQWYISNTKNGTFSRIPNATGSSYSITPTKNIHEEYYYCIVNNGYYTAITRTAKLVADITLPEITMGNFEQNIIINDTVTLKIPFTVSDTGEGYVENGSNFTASDFIVKVGDIANNSVSKSLEYKGGAGNNFNYELTLSNITSDGKLSFEIPADSIKDNFQNGNALKPFSTNVMIDNTEPKITLDSVVSGINDKYANQEDEIVIRLAVEELVGMNTNEFNADDIIVKVNGNVAGAILIKRLEYTERVDDKYIYTLTLNKVTGDGELSINIPANSMKDLANNSNLVTELIVKNSNGDSIIIDNTEPEIQSLLTKLEGFDSDRDYPTYIAYHHDRWSNEDIYVTIKATDNEKIDCYMKSIGNNSSYMKIASFQEVINKSVNAIIYYKVVDMAGNFTEISKEIKLDKITPEKPQISLYEQRLYGAVYEFDQTKPTDKSVYVIPAVETVVDYGNVQSGIEKDITYTYYTITRYKDPTKSEQLGSILKFAWDEGFLLKESGYYEMQMTMVDIAGNQVVSDIYEAYVDKRAENTIRITNINDIGSGIKKVTIRIYKSDLSGNQLTEEAINPIVIDDPYKEIIKNVRLGDGKFFVEVTIEDNVGLMTVLKRTIINKL